MLIDPSTMSEEELRAYVAKLENSLTALTAQQAKAAPLAKPWLEGEKRWVNIPPSPTNDVYTINGKPFIGRRLVDLPTWNSLQESHNKAIASEMARMQTRGNMVPLHMLPADDVSSRSQPVTIANLN